MTRMLFAGLALSMGLPLSGCIRKAAEAEIPGTYIADYGFAKETLQLNGNREFDQVIKVMPSGPVASAHGTWRFDQGDSDIYFSNEFLVVADGFGKLIPNFDHPERKAISILPVRHSLRGLQIGLDPGVPYRKQGKNNSSPKI